MIGDHVGKPKLRIPNPLGSAQTGGSQTSQSSQSGQTAASVVGEREVHSFLENWHSALSKKDVEALSSSYLQLKPCASIGNRKNSPVGSPSKPKCNGASRLPKVSR